MVSRDAIRTGVGIVGNVIALILFLSPVPTFIRIWKKGSVEQYSPIPYLATFINCGLWVLYGLPVVHPKSTLVVTINGTGVVIEIVYLLLFIIYSSDRKMKVKVVAIMVAEMAFLAVLAFLVLSLAHTFKLRSTIVGSICMVGNILMYASPLAVMKLVIATKSVEYMPFSLSLASFANGICWTVYALIRFDPFIAAPNGMGAVLGLAQLLLYAKHYQSSKRPKEERWAKGELSQAEKGMSQETQNSHHKMVTIDTEE